MTKTGFSPASYPLSSYDYAFLRPVEKELM